MTAIDLPPDPGAPLQDRISLWASSRVRRSMLFAFGLVLLLSVTQQFARPVTTDITSTGTWEVALGFSVPIFLAGLGAIFSERSGIVNIGLDGMMVLGTWFGAFYTLVWGPWWGLLMAGIAGAVGALVHAIATVSFGVDHIVSGVAILLIAPGVTRYLSDVHFNDRGGSITQSPTITGVGEFEMPFLGGGSLFGWDTPDILGRIGGWDWFFVSDLCRIARGLISGMSWFTVIVILLIPVSIWVLWRTTFGLRLRSCGEHPDAADSLGVNVYRYKYYGVIISGLLSGFGGGFLAVQLTGIYKEAQVQGRGFIGLATMIFGNWHPVGTALGALLFGFAQTLQLRDPDATHGLILLVAIALTVLFVRALVQRNTRSAGWLAAASVAMWIWYLTTDNVPQQLPQITPFLAVLFVLFFRTQRLRMPAADGLPWRKGEH